MFDVLFPKVTLFTVGWIVVASAGRAVTYIGALMVWRLGYY
jgi:hypothetical protein